MVINLTVNAIKFCNEDGRVRLWAKVNPHAAGVIVGVTDNGPGIEQADLKTIFERFRQLDVGLRASCKGFGLGLSIVQDLVELNFGKINVESEVAKGSTFTFTLPPNEPLEIMRRYLQRIALLHDDSPQISLITARIDKSADPAMAEDIDMYLQGLLRRNDLALQADDHHWVLVIASGDIALDEFYDNASQTFERVNRNRIHGPLPEVVMHTEGTWQPLDRFDGVLTHLAGLLKSSATSLSPDAPGPSAEDGIAEGLVAC